MTDPGDRSSPAHLLDQRDLDVFTASGQQRIVAGTVASSGQPFRVTLAWTDPPGATPAAAYVNDLDLEVNVGGQLYRGNVFSGATSATGGSSDTRNNVESVFLPAGLTAGRSGLGAITNFDASGFSTRIGAEVKDFPRDAGILDRKLAKFASRTHRFALAAAAEALVDPERTPVLVGVAQLTPRDVPPTLRK